MVPSHHCRGGRDDINVGAGAGAAAAADDDDDDDDNDNDDDDVDDNNVHAMVPVLTVYCRYCYCYCFQIFTISKLVGWSVGWSDIIVWHLLFLHISPSPSSLSDSNVVVDAASAVDDTTNVYIQYFLSSMIHTFFVGVM